MDKVSFQGDGNGLNPTPADFDRFLPWACTQLSVEFDIIITRRVIAEYVSKTVKSKGKPKSKAPSYSGSSSDVTTDESVSHLMEFTSECPIYIETIYDNNLNLLKLKFLKNRNIPRVVLKIISLTLRFHKSLYSITINSGLQKETIYEISKILSLSTITDLCLDNTFLIEANYHILLDQGLLKYLSLSKCKINDTVIKIIASKLVQPYSASKILSILNLASNRITDEGALYIANALRTNRQLSYLNLADNMISDKGAISIFNSLAEFPLTVLESNGKRARYMNYLKKKKELILKTVKEIRAGDFEKKAARRRSTKPILPLQKKSKLMDNTGDGTSMPNLDCFFYDKAGVIADGIMGPFNDPFSPNNTEIRDGVVYCYGNNSLCYLNLAYNNLTYFSIKILYEVVTKQKLLDRKPKGLINVIIDGNYLPSICSELQQIDYLLELNLSEFNKTSAHPKKKTPNSGTASSK